MSDPRPTFEEEVRAATPMVEAVHARARRSLVLWCGRWAITACIYWWFWRYEWVRWTLILTVPFGLFSLYMIHKMGWRLPKKHDRAVELAKEVDALDIHDPAPDE